MREAEQNIMPISVASAPIVLGEEDFGPQYGVLTPKFLGDIQRAEEAAIRRGIQALNILDEVARQEKEEAERLLRRALDPEGATIERMLEGIDLTIFPESDDRGGIA